MLKNVVETLGLLSGRDVEREDERLLLRRRSSLAQHVYVELDERKKIERDDADRNAVRNSLVAGSLGGMASTLVLYPMDMLRTNLQASGSTTGGPLQLMRQIVNVGGIRALYTGCALPLAAQAVFKGTVFAINDAMERAIVDHKRNISYNALGENSSGVNLTVVDRSFCGLVAGAINAGLFVTPVEYVRNQLIAQQAKLAVDSTTSSGVSSHQNVGTTWGVIRRAIQVDGILSLWRGVGITILRDGVGVACFFGAMAATEQFLTHSFHEGENRHLFSIRVASGAMAGLAYWVSSLPLDTVKTWIQSADSSVRISPMHEIQQIYQNSGTLGVVHRLNRGWQVAYGRGIPSAAITIGVYSSVYQLLRNSDN